MLQEMLIILLECSLSMSVLILLLLALIPWLSRRYAAKWLYCTWLVIALGLLVPFRFHPAAPLIKMSVVPSSFQRIIAEIPENSAGLPVAAGTPVHHHVSALSLPQLLFFLWSAGSVVFLLKNIWKHHRFLAMVRRWGKEVKDPETLNLLSRIKEEMGIAGQVDLLICPCVTSPMMIGFYHPAVLLPRVNFSPHELSLVLRHELVHLKRRDLWYKCLVLLATALHWFNPLVYLMGREIDTWCEISCDAEVVKGENLEERQCYSATILRVAGGRASFPTVLSTSFTGGKRALRNRLRFILGSTARKRTGILLLCLVLLGTLGTGMIFTVPGKADATALSFLSAWQAGQKSSASEEDKVRLTVDIYFNMGYADRMSASFVPRTALLGAVAPETPTTQTWAQYADVSLRYDILCWQAQGYVPISYTYIPHYDGITVGKNGLTATVTVEPICDLYFASRSTPDRTGLEKHVLTLQKQNNIWRIVGDTSDMDSVSYPPGTDFDELTKTFPAHFAAWKNEQTQLAAQAETEASTMKRNGDQRFRLLDIQKSALSLP